MHLTVGYLATPTGDDGVALAGALARTFDADVDVVLVVRDEFPDGHPGRARVPGDPARAGPGVDRRGGRALATGGVGAHQSCWSANP